MSMFIISFLFGGLLGFGIVASANTYYTSRRCKVLLGIDHNDRELKRAKTDVDLYTASHPHMTAIEFHQACKDRMDKIKLKKVFDKHTDSLLWNGKSPY